MGEQEHRLRLRQPWEHHVEEGVRLHDWSAGDGNQDHKLCIWGCHMEGSVNELQRADDYLRYYRESVELPGHDHDLAERAAIGDVDEEWINLQLQLRY